LFSIFGMRTKFGYPDVRYGKEDVIRS